MAIDRKSVREFAYHLATGLFFNLIVLVLLVNAYFAESPTARLAAGLRIILACWVLVLAAKAIKRFWPNIRHAGYYFLPTTVIFWVLNERKRRLDAEAGTARVDKIIRSWPDASLEVIAGIVDPTRQHDTLIKLVTRMDKMRDSYLATITDRIRRYLGLILESVNGSEDYHLFRQVMWRLSSYEPGEYRLTYKRCQVLLFDVFDPSLSSSFGRRFQREMIGPLKMSISQAGRAYAGRVRRMIGRIMADDSDEHEVQIRIAEMLLQLDWSYDRETCRVIFDESLKRAFRFPRSFGIELLNILNRLEHRMFWLDMDSLRSILEEAKRHEAEGLVGANRQVYKELCSKILSPVEDPDHDGIRNGRVFRRLKHDDGRVGIECVWPDGRTCSCLGESLSFRGVYSKDCSRKVGERLDMRITPIREVERRFAVKASITPLHTYESASNGPGRGAFFEDAEPTEVKELYEYVSTK
jgi:hypothetical protein